MYGKAVFTYGTLQIPAIMTAVTGHAFVHHEASLPGYVRYRIRKQVFPGIVPNKLRYVPGIVYQGLDADTVRLLDHFEDDLYERQTVAIEVDGKTQRAEAYVVARRHYGLLEKRSWSLEQFRSNYLQQYLESCRRFRRIHVGD